MSENENKKVIYQKSVGISALPYVFAAVVLPALIVYIGEKVINQEHGDINRILIGTAVILLLGGVVTFIAYKKLNSIIQLVINMLLGSYLRIREGDLTTQFTMKENRLFTSQIDPSKHYTHQNELQNITRAFSDMTHNFKDMVSRIQEQTNSVFRMSSELTEIAKQTNKSTEEVSQTIVSIAEETFIQTIETKQMAEDVKILSDYFTQIEESLLRIGGYMEETNEANSINQTHMTNIDINGKKSNETLKTLMDSIFEVNDYVQKVQTMTKVISDISDQTNLLALNASIEAAHAGEQGKGFAVVAEEVRKLAEQSTIASNDISEIIEIVQEKSKEMVDNVRQTSENGATQSEAIKETLSSAKIVSDQVILVTNEITETIKLTDEMNGKKDFLLNSTKEILLVAENNAAGIEEVSANTEEILATMEEFSAKIAEMNVISHQLKEKTDLFITQDNKEATLKIIEKLKK